jgi:acyl-CoA ligase (AMP-forming) (exosortase A-associated)
MDFLLHHMLDSSAQRFTDKIALFHGQQRLSYGDVARQAAGLAHGLRQAGLTRGDRVGIYLNASIPQGLSIFGVSQAGAVFVPINPLLLPEQVIHIACDCQIKGLITTASKLIALGDALKQIPALRFVVVVANDTVPGLPLPVHDFDRLCQQPPLSRADDVAIGNDLAALLYTSGSTGKPKGVMLSHAQIMAGASIVSDYLSITEADRILAILPFSFDAGLNQLMTAFQQGATLVLMTFVFAREIVRTLAQEEITALAGVPTLWSLLVQPNTGLHSQPLPHLRYITNTGGTMPQSVLTELRSHLPTTQIFLMYGLTEAFRSTYLPPEQLNQRPGSMGKAIPNTEILVINEDGQPCGPGEIGELVHRGPTVSMGYWQQPELTAQRLRPHPLLPPELANKELVCYSGDLVKRDEDGFLYFIGRRDALIKSSGFRISPTEVEEVLMRSELLQGAAVVGIADDILGQTVKAFVVPKVGIVLDIAALIGFCAEHLPRYMVPKQVESLAALPTTSSGKVDYPALRRDGAAS